MTATLLMTGGPLPACPGGSGHVRDLAPAAPLRYRKLAGEAVANQAELRGQLPRLTEQVGAVEQLMREVG
jgi:hypothetical protein